jgi:catechol 2,3-dioxygenase-like lactoylglutathione lyase family enzyme
MPGDLSIAVFSVPVTDQHRARDFYRDKLGFVIVTEHPGVMGPGRDWIQMAARGGGSAITLVNWFDTMPAGSLRGLVVETDDIEAEHRRLRDVGVTIDDIQNEPWGRFATFRDSEGNGLVLMTPMGEQSP